MEIQRYHKKPVIIGLIHAKWCGHCRNLMPAWQQMRTSISQKPYHPTPQFMEVEHSNLDMLDRFNSDNSAYLNGQRVQSDGFPTIFKIRNGNIEYYKDMREPSMMEKWFMHGQSQQIPKQRIPKTKRYRNRRKSAAARRRRRTIRRRKSL